MKKNDSCFICANCGAAVEKLGITSRNHCPRCLYSMHLDIEPGDRAAGCGGLMRPAAVTQSAKKGYIIRHVCTSCGAERNNKSAPDDDFNVLLEISRNNAKQ